MFGGAPKAASAPPPPAKPSEKLSGANGDAKAMLSGLFAKPAATPAAADLKLKEDPAFAKYFKMLAMHLPPPAVKQKMSAEGLDPSVLDMDPEGLSPNAGGGAGRAPKPPRSPGGGGGGGGDGVGSPPSPPEPGGGGEGDGPTKAQRIAAAMNAKAAAAPAKPRESYDVSARP
jgi:hypothetical protein